MATYTAKAMWKLKNLAGYVLPKIQNRTMSPIASEIENSLQNLPEDLESELQKTT
jgi:hypothetical protein